MPLKRLRSIAPPIQLKADRQTIGFWEQNLLAVVMLVRQPTSRMEVGCNWMIESCAHQKEQKF
ncbi:hypothetical protein A4U53_002355 (plasmid) [Rhizobium ruizarguesonis]|uniref:Uncharacterized protein n=1 Tax=Rhizobium ruizarguesonis TaxID=2081791 RepID=A0ACD5EFY1_9HYPH